MATAGSVIIEVKGNYFSPTESAFRDIYGCGIEYGGSISYGIWKNLEVWLGGSYFIKNGEATFTKEQIKLKILPIGAGIGYSHPFGKVVSIYGRVGVNYYSYKEESSLENITDSGLDL